MFQLKNARLDRLAVHRVGSKTDPESLDLSKEEITPDEDILNLLKKFFLKPFTEERLFSFKHTTDINLNECYHYIKEVFSDPEKFYDNSRNIATLLHSESRHPNIKTGELYLAYFDDVNFGESITEAIGIFKSESKETYLKVYPKKSTYQVEAHNGVNINKLDKGCLIFNTEEEDGYRMLIIDKTNKGGEAQYWMDDFLQVKIHENNYYHTEAYLDLCMNFVEEVFPEADKIDKIGMKQNAANYFKEKEAFNVKEFEEEVMQEPEIIDAFNNFKSQYQEAKQVKTYDEFDINKSAVKKSDKFIKSILKLDKNFHIYIHGDRSRIEKGYDEDRQLNYYTVYYEEEN
ncbi:nucleoid-associated protein [Marinigracilibium pacificum]|uniref:Nucleoid-associated protein n=1 Tax=Marinigracilibium pacificum TaxID=2729599 RepID=A0A848ITL4_9BACT|nr:nucleoid-associated protein [Marinigracilibium pacificum]NMM47096.1 nucleoid-associated protein [Marinigracilibium pacificum]